MPNYPRPKSSMPKKPTKSSLHPHGFPSFSETVEGLKNGMINLGSHLVGAGAGIVGNLIGALTNLKKSAQEGDEDAEKAYLDAIAMLRSSGSSAAESMLTDLGEDLSEEEQNEKTSEDLLEPNTEDSDFGLNQSSPAAPQEVPAEGKTLFPPKDSAHNGKIVCLECGAEYKQLTRSHLLKHGMTPQEYREKHGLLMNSPLSGKTKTREDEERMQVS